MANPNAVLSTVDFRPGFDPGGVDFSDYLALAHFLEVPTEPGTLEPWKVRLLGFGAPYSRRGGFDKSDEVVPILNPYELHPADCTIDKQGKGVGPRMYNTPQAALGLTELPEMLGAYTFDISPNMVKDVRNSGTKATQILRHASRIVRARLTSAADVASQVNFSYGTSLDAALLSQPPRAELRQKLERHEQDPGVPGEFLIIRNAAIRLHRVGDIPVWD